MTEDLVTISVGGREIAIKNYEIDVRYLTIPSRFRITVGSASTCLSLMNIFKPNERFELRINKTLQFSGRIDGYEQPSPARTELTVMGRDCTAPLVDCEVEIDQTFSGETETFASLLAKCANLAGLHGKIISFQEEIDNQKIVSGQSSAISAPSVDQKVTTATGPAPGQVAQLLAVVNGDVLTADQLRAKFAAANPTEPVTTKTTGVGSSGHPIHAKVGETTYAVWKKEGDRAGIFLRAGVDPTGQTEYVFILSQPDGSQAPTFTIANSRGAPMQDNIVNVEGMSFVNNTTHQYGYYIVYGRGGGGASGQKQIRGFYEDKSMTSLGFAKKMVRKDPEVKTQAQAQHLAERLAAEARRAGKTVTYTVKGHTSGTLSSPKAKAIWPIGCVVQVIDDEHGIYANYWLEGTTFRGREGSGTTTELHLIHVDDLIFGGPGKKTGSRGPSAGRHVIHTPGGFITVKQ